MSQALRRADSPFQSLNASCTLSSSSAMLPILDRPFERGRLPLRSGLRVDFPGESSGGCDGADERSKNYLATRKNTAFPLMIEDTWDFNAVNDTNDIGATHGWFDLFRLAHGVSSVWQPADDGLYARSQLGVSVQLPDRAGHLYREPRPHQHNLSGRWARLVVPRPAIYDRAGDLLWSRATGQRSGIRPLAEFSGAGERRCQPSACQPQAAGLEPVSVSVGQAIYAMYQFLLLPPRRTAGSAHGATSIQNYHNQWIILIPMVTGWTRRRRRLTHYRE